MKRQIIWIHWQEAELGMPAADDVPGVAEMERDILDEFRLDQDPLTLERLDLSLLEMAAEIAPLYIDKREFTKRAKEIRQLGDAVITIWTPDSQIHNYQANALLRDFLANDLAAEPDLNEADDMMSCILVDWFQRGRMTNLLH